MSIQNYGAAVKVVASVRRHTSKADLSSNNGSGEFQKLSRHYGGHIYSQTAEVSSYIYINFDDAIPII